MADSAELERAASRRQRYGTQSLQLRHMLGREFFQAGHPQQPHGPGDAGGQDLDRAFDPRFATSHQPIQVRPPNQRAPRTERDRGDDIGTGHDAGVHHDLGVLAQLAGNQGQQVERRRRTIELATA